MLFEMRAANDGNPTPEEAEMLSELRAVCEQHLNVLARSVERGAGLIGESLLMKCIEVAESLVSAIGDGEKPGDDASSGGAGGTQPRDRARETPRGGTKRRSWTSSADSTLARPTRRPRRRVPARTAGPPPPRRRRR